MNARARSISPSLQSSKRSASERDGGNGSLSPISSGLRRPLKRHHEVGEFGSNALMLWGGTNCKGDAQDKPVYMEAFSKVGVEYIGCGRSADGRSFLLTESGELREWKSREHGSIYQQGKEQDCFCSLSNLQILIPLAVTQVSCGYNHYAAITTNNDLYTWGGGAFGELGHGTEEDHYLPKRVDALVQHNKHIKQVVCGDFHTVSLTISGEVLAWGSNTAGRTGHGETDGYQLVPKRVERLAGVRVMSISTGSAHTAVVTETGEVYTWGFGKNGELGHSQGDCCHVPTLVKAMQGRKVKQVSCGSNHTGVVTEDGRCFTFGGNRHGKLGHSDKVKRLTPTAVQALEGVFVSSISCGVAHTACISNTGEVYTWGMGGRGQLGHGSFENQLEPRKVERFKDSRVISVTALGDYTLALVEPSSLAPDEAPMVMALRSMINDKEHSDVTFLVENETIHAHRAILVRRCKMFATMFRLGMRESNQQQQEPIPIPGLTKKIFLLILEFLYTGVVDIHVDQAIDLYVAADMYGLTRLQDKCASTLHRNLTPERAGLLLRTADESRFPELKDICLRYVVENLPVVSKTNGLKDVSHALLLEIIRGVSSATTSAASS
mmetsp:Transcript_24145/g.66907  ORF Transcript_24145/g.66907 Transcript_24145/m.66907 type:complete len:608 (-) Transcript_24145:79-1902(-)|eukprot:CAMPEP_0168758592 /NCGR_PEP_ID=MMETSP0724-20121128/21783_1 /TAXON_ID=265536 /ORGANISM="Amphiprora sp., Strain CCMP467" /LENGTH=607 /DNA_ID=CAMNT_0008807481 /DNA_START=20 /DNA_END=1843 /DNA_ORIENTATION=-